jgi:hypothetical protein
MQVAKMLVNDEEKLIEEISKESNNRTSTSYRQYLFYVKTRFIFSFYLNLTGEILVPEKLTSQQSTTMTTQVK